jgi:hypothetical protein
MKTLPAAVKSALALVRKAGAEGLPRECLQGLVRAYLFAGGLVEERGGRLFLTEQSKPPGSVRR